MSHHIEKINAWTCYNAYAWVPFFTYMAHAFGVISLEDWVLKLWFSNLRVKLAKHEVMVSIIFITLLTMGSTSHPFKCLEFPLPFPCLLGFWISVSFNTWSLWQFGLVCPRIPQWWQYCWVFRPLCALGRDLPLALGLASIGV